MIYTSTRSDKEFISSSEAILKGIADDGGLYVPTDIPRVSITEDLLKMSYTQLAYFITKQYFTDFDDIDLKTCIEKAYDNKFDTELIVPLVEKNDLFFMELYHGPTLAFKDMALSILPHLLKTSIKKNKIDKEIVILTATSGDTGKAALESFANIDGVKIIVFFPENGVSEIQKRQMITQEGNNVFVVGIDGNFDDAQNGVKEIFNDKNFIDILYKDNYMLSSANSINVGRLIPQIVYYFYGYLELLKNKKIKFDEKINLVVPTGNFGNILASYYAKKMGLPVNKLICASNENNVLYDFFNSGIYDKKRSLNLTISPSMDILVSSNLERLLYEISNKNKELTKELMKSLQLKGEYVITKSMKEELKDFYAGYVLEDKVLYNINKVYNSSGYVMDTHTAVAYSVYEKYKQETKDYTQTIIASTASPYKFGRSICKSLNIEVDKLNDFDVAKELSNNTGIKIPDSIKALENKKIIHNNLYKKDKIKYAIKKFLNV